jgi:uncharacterized protein YbbK (DUF523 family)
MIIISSCLAGIPCRYDGKATPDAECIRLVEEGRAMPACPELMGGLAAPREPCEIVGGDGEDVLCGRARILNKKGQDVTKEFIAGAKKFLEFLQLKGADMVYLKAKSPSCGAGIIYDGTFGSRLKPGDGVTVALLKRSGIRVESR